MYPDNGTSPVLPAWARALILDLARWRVWVWHPLLVFAEHGQDRAYNRLVRLEARWL